MLVLKGSKAEEDQQSLAFIDIVNVAITGGRKLVLTLFANYVQDFDNFSVVWNAQTLAPSVTLALPGRGVFGVFELAVTSGATSCVDVNVTTDPYPNSMILTAYEEVVS